MKLAVPTKELSAEAIELDPVLEAELCQRFSEELDLLARLTGVDVDRYKQR